MGAAWHGICELTLIPADDRIGSSASSPTFLIGQKLTNDLYFFMEVRFRGVLFTSDNIKV
jgi:hypothetical protein